MLGIDMPDTFSSHTKQVNAMAMYRPRGSTHRPQTEVVTWQESLQDCTDIAIERGEVWQGRQGAGSSSGLAVMGPTLGPLCDCVATRLAAAGRHHKGLLAIYPMKPTRR